MSAFPVPIPAAAFSANPFLRAVGWGSWLTSIMRLAPDHPRDTDPAEVLLRNARALRQGWHEPGIAACGCGWAMGADRALHAFTCDDEEHAELVAKVTAEFAEEMGLELVHE